MPPFREPASFAIADVEPDLVECIPLRLERGQHRWRRLSSTNFTDLHRFEREGGFPSVHRVDPKVSIQLEIAANLFASHRTDALMSCLQRQAQGRNLVQNTFRDLFFRSGSGVYGLAGACDDINFILVRFET